jgi:hypothetical protein
VVLPESVGHTDIAECVRQWCPDVVSGNDPFLTFDTFELHGPVRYDADDLLGTVVPPVVPPMVPPGYPQAFALTYTANEADSGQAFWIGYDCATGLARRLRGLCRPGFDDEPWDEPWRFEADPWVHAPVELSPEETLRLLAPFLPGLRVEVHDEVTREFRLDGDGVVIWCDPITPTLYPLVRRQPWFTFGERSTDYQFNSDSDPAALTRVAEAAQALAARTRGVILDEDGYPWPKASHESSLPSSTVDHDF